MLRNVPSVPVSEGPSGCAECSYSAARRLTEFDMHICIDRSQRVHVLASGRTNDPRYRQAVANSYRVANEASRSSAASDSMLQEVQHHCNCRFMVDKSTHLKRAISPTHCYTWAIRQANRMEVLLRSRILCLTTLTYLTGTRKSICGSFPEMVLIKAVAVLLLG